MDPRDAGGRTAPRVAGTMLGASALTTLGAIAPFLVGSQAVLMQRDLAFGPGILGAGVSTFFATAAVLTVTASGVYARLSARARRMVAGGLVAAGGLGVALLVHRWALLVVALAVLGGGNAACQATSNIAVATVLPPRRRGLGFGIKQSAVPAAIMFGGLAVPTLTSWWGWRSSFLIVGLLGVAVVVLAIMAPGEHQEGRRVADSDRAPADYAPRGPLLLAGVAITFAAAAANFLGVYLASWAHGVGLTVGQAGVLMAAGSASSIVMRVLVGYRADGRHGGNMSVVVAETTIGAACLTLIGLLPSLWPVTVFGFLAFMLGWSWSGLLLFAIARVGRDSPARALGVVQAGAFVGGAVGPVSFGLIVDGAGFATAWVVAGGAFACASVLALLARTGFRRDLRRLFRIEGVAGPVGVTGCG